MQVSVNTLFLLPRFLLATSRGEEYSVKIPGFALAYFTRLSVIGWFNRDVASRAWPSHSGLEFYTA